VRVATPLPFRVALPSSVAPSKKATVPVGVPTPGAAAVTVAVRTTGSPKTTVEKLAAIAVALEACWTGSAAVPALPAKLALPP